MQAFEPILDICCGLDVQSIVACLIKTNKETPQSDDKENADKVLIHLHSTQLI